MQAVEELEKTETAIITRKNIARKKITTDETRKIMEAGILLEESGWELINGEIVRPLTIGSNHAGTVKKLNRIFTRLVGEQAIVSVQDPIHINDFDEPEPDIALLKPREDFYTKSHPEPEDVLLLIEVSNSTLEFDRDAKKSLYAAAGIDEFWLVNLKENTLEVYSQPKNGAYHLARILEKGETVESETIKNLVLNVEEILGA